MNHKHPKDCRVVAPGNRPGSAPPFLLRDGRAAWAALGGDGPVPGVDQM